MPCQMGKGEKERPLDWAVKGASGRGSDGKSNGFKRMRLRRNGKCVLERVIIGRW